MTDPQPIPIPQYEVKEAGNYKRRYDSLSEANENDEEEIILADVLQWLQGLVGGEGYSPKSPILKELAAAGLTLEQVDKIAAFHQLRESPYKSSILERLGSTIKDLYYAARDIISGNRIKTSLTIAGGIAIGAAAGAILGTLVFPGIGTAVGGALGSLISGVLALVGGGVGMGILGAFAGSWLGKKIANKFFKDEKHYELSKRVTREIQKKMGIPSDVTKLMNSYVYNRSLKIRSPLCQHYYKILRKGAILNADPQAMESLARFFCKELELLKRERKPGKADRQLQSEIEIVMYILQNLQASKLSVPVKHQINKTLNAFHQPDEDKPVPGMAAKPQDLLPQHEKDKKKKKQKQKHKNKDKAAAAPAPVPAQGVAQDAKPAVQKPVQPNPAVAGQQVGVKVINPPPAVPVGEAKRNWDPSHPFVHPSQAFREACSQLGVENKDVETIPITNGFEHRYHLTLPNKVKLPDIVTRGTIENGRESTEILVDKSQVTPENQDKMAQLIIEHAKISMQARPDAQLMVCAAGDDKMAILLTAKALQANTKPVLDESEYPTNTDQARAKREHIMAQAYEMAGVAPPKPVSTVKIGLVK